MDEYERILSNPDNFIMSEDLMDRLEQEEQSSSDVVLFLDSQNFNCHLSSYSRSSNPDKVRLTLDVTHIDFSKLFSAESMSCEVCGESFEFDSYFEYENVAGRSILILETTAGGF